MTPEPIYLDHNATTPPKPAVIEAMRPLLAVAGNASATHRAGRAARAAVERARAQVALCVNAGPQAVAVFTSGATEANNLALKGCGCERVLVSATEHASVLQARGDAETVPVLPDGLIDLVALDRMLEGNTRQTLLSVMLVNNETGVIQPVDKVMEIARKRGALLHCDAAQALGRVPVDIQKLGVDYMTLSSHKIGGPQGAGCLVMANCVSVAPQISGGGQEKNMRAGTENIAAIAGFGLAAELAVQDMAEYRKLAVLRDRVEAALKKIAPAVTVFGEDAPRVANTSMFALPGLAADTQMIALDLAGICVSNGSACGSGTVKASHVLKAMGAEEGVASCALRVSFGWNSTAADADAFIQKWAEIHQRTQRRASHG
ncbi:MAG: cysteine desulfurase [Alphaproteobacteria bacterium]|nr:cysteine desulfurase [Alphaproteobacteria bacterium]MDE2335837.1 cysteine desulfurase [Alphaproteobacteria bacterium]